MIGFERDSLVSGGIPPERITKFAVIETEQDGLLKRVIEKPEPEVLRKLPAPLLVSMNCWRFDEAIFAACLTIGPSPRGELELQDAVAHLVEQRARRFAVVSHSGQVLDLSSRADVAPVKERLRDVEVAL